MLFKGVPVNQLVDWENATKRAEDSSDLCRWLDIVGVNNVAAQDRNLFRVLEWGGMEVLR